MAVAILDYWSSLEEELDIKVYKNTQILKEKCMDVSLPNNYL